MEQSQSQGYLSLPASGRGPGVLVLHAWWGLNDFFRGFCDQLAQAGFVARAPDLFGGTVLKTIEEAEQHQKGWDEEHEVPPILLPTIDDLVKHPAVTSLELGVIGFSMGAFWSLWLADHRPEFVRAVDIFYGTDGGWNDFKESNAVFQGHFAENDPYEDAPRVKALEEKLKAVNRPVTFYTYPGTGHWFFEKDRPDAYNPDAAQLAWERTLAFLKSAMA